MRARRLLLSVVVLALSAPALAAPSVPGALASPHALAPAAPAAPVEEEPSAGGECTVEGLLGDVREGMRTGSPALRRYLKKLLVEAALVLPPEVLLAEFEREQDPAVVEAIGAALAERALFDENPALVKDVLARAASDDDPALRAAALRALRSTPSVELMQANGGEVSYPKLIQDESAEVRAAVVDNLLAEDDDVYSGHHQALSEAALETAFAAEDPAARARLLNDISTEAVGQESARSLMEGLSDDDEGVRAASARALGGLSPPSASGAKEALLARFDEDQDLFVRRQIVESLVRLERVRAVPLLHALKGEDARLGPEIDAWLSALSLGLHEWPLLLREKQRLFPS